MTFTGTCLRCKAAFEKRLPAKFCSDNCRTRFNQTRPTQANRIRPQVDCVCRLCGHPFVAQRGARYCSHRCRDAAYRNPDSIINAGQERPLRATRHDWCGAHRRPRPCDSCVRVSETQRRLWQDPQRVKRHIERMAHRERGATWSREEEAIIRQHANKVSTAELAALCAAESHVPRSTKAVSRQARRMGLFLNERETYSLSGVHSLGKLFGVADVTVVAWRARGFIRGRAWGKFWQFDPEEIEAFIRAQPWAYDVDRMQRGRYRSLAEVVHQRQRWYRATEIAKMARIRRDAVLKYAREGVVEAKVRNGHNGAVMIRGEDIPLLLQACAEGRKRGVAKPEYAEMGEARAIGDAPLFVEVAS